MDAALVEAPFVLLGEVLNILLVACPFFIAPVSDAHVS